jgi:hypothetical protein
VESKWIVLVNILKITLDAIWDSEVTLTGIYWVVEMKIPTFYDFQKKPINKLGFKLHA